MQFDVAIVGCGPVGALLANLLGKAGLRVVILEKELELHPLPRAVHLDHEMLRLCQSVGLADTVLADMRETDGHLHLGADLGIIRYMGTVGKPRPFGWANDYFFYQPEFEAHLRDGLKRWPQVDLIVGAEFTELVQASDRVKIRFRKDNQEHSIAASWVVACDGSSSAVRKSLEIELEDLDFEEPWLVVDADVPEPVHFPEVGELPDNADLQRLSVMICNPERPATIVPGRGSHRRWEFMLLPGEDDRAMMQPDKVSQLLEPYLQGIDHEIIRAATYRFHGLVAKKWKYGRVFLAGDAAHQTPPFFGQGMCHGFRDVANLAWKMAAIANDNADESILNTYQQERDPHVRAVIGAAIDAGRYICLLDRAQAAGRDVEMRAMVDFGKSQTAAELIPAIVEGIIAAGTPAAGERFIQPQFDDGSFLDDHVKGGWRLFVRSEQIAGSDLGVTRVEAKKLPDHGKSILAWMEIHRVDAVLVRPDHYVFGTTCKSAEELLRCREDWLTGQKVQKEPAS